MWPFKKKTTSRICSSCPLPITEHQFSVSGKCKLCQEEFELLSRPKPLCGDYGYHYGWLDIEQMPCPRCAYIKRRQDQAARVTKLYNTIADGEIEAIKMLPAKVIDGVTYIDREQMVLLVRAMAEARINQENK